ncbi:GIY-YIG nuclease family protein [Solibacillus sp. FSL W7-1464]|uniref:GIY-YIG nuclease family protein n=1 Tax=Solibacillus sp. FSL W7-1464 TaxID=2921706 RepID=UPI0030F659FE
MKTFGFVYITINKANGKAYIGKCIYQRQNNWESYLGSGLYLKKAIKKYGKENFIRFILEEAYSSDELNNLEEYYIKQFNAVNSPYFYNLKLTAIGGDCFTNNPRKEEIRQMRVKQMSGKGNNQYGKPKTKRMIESVKQANSRAILIDDIYYKSLSEVSFNLGIGITTIAYRLDSSKFPNYKRLFPKHPKERYTSHTKTKKIEVDNIIYNGQNEALKKLNISKTTLNTRLNSDKFPNYKRLE